MFPVIIIDGYNFVYRAYHVQPKLTSPEGLEVGALYGFSSMLIRIMNEFQNSNKIIAFDAKGPNFRHKIYPDYKAHRPETEQDLISQFPLVREAARAFGFNILEKAGYEADDIIATIARRISKEHKKLIIISSDKDLMQLVDDKISIYDPIKNKFIKPNDVVEKLGVEPSKVLDYLALVGDKSDNIPGVPSIGPKTAAELLNAYGNLDGIYQNIHEIKQNKRRETLIENEDKARLSKQLARLEDNMELYFEDIEHKLCPDKITAFLNKFGFKSLGGRLSKLGALSESTPEKQQYTNSPMEKIITEAKEQGKVAIFLDQEESVVLYSASSTCPLMIDAISKIKDILTDSSIIKITDNSKKLYHLCLQYNLDIKAVEDLSLMLYATSAGLKQEVNDLLKALGLSIFELYANLKDRLLQNQALDIYRNMDQPLASLLCKMEHLGIKVDKEALKKLSDQLAKEIDEKAAKIYQLAGCEFNISSPKQLGEVLFDKMQLPAPKTSKKTSNYMTNADILEELYIDGYEIAEHILSWRQMSKLRNTYTEALQQHIAADGRIHSNFQQNVTLTGRLSSNEPNLQNIPVKTEKGRLIRKAFFAEQGYKLIAADYSQMELRILAYIADIKEMQQAFEQNLDIHSQTAQQVFRLPASDITSTIRRQAKAINFGIIYGLSAFGLAKQLGISRNEASDYIKKYFATYPGIEAYISKTKECAEENGYVKTITGRRCYIPDIRSSDYMAKSFAARSAINAPIQGSAADIARYAMVKLHDTLSKKHPKTRMLLQIHDELIFETPAEEVENVAPIIRTIMEDIRFLPTKFVVDLKIGDDWLSMNQI